jgi:uncharacterized protein YjbI with pentapeptide repeats
LISVTPSSHQPFISDTEKRHRRSSLAFVIVLVALAIGSIAEASSYQKTDATIVDPIQWVENVGGGNHGYLGSNLEPGALLDGEILYDAVLNRADLHDASLVGMYLDYSELRGADLRNANLFLAIVRQVDLSGADLRNANLEFAFMSGSNFTGADLSASNLADADLSFTTLDATNLTAADLRGADLDSASLIDADLSGAELRNARLWSAVMTGADLSEADLRGASFMFAVDLDSTFGSAYYDSDTDFSGTGFDPVATGWILGAPAELVPSLNSFGVAFLGFLIALAGWCFLPASRKSLLQRS